MTVVGLIPARAGSERVVGKNLVPLAGKPLIAHTCEAAHGANVLDAVYVNTDSPEIAAVATEAGVSAPTLRPAALAGPGTPTRDANLHVLEFLARRGERYDAVMVLQPTSPLRTTADIQAAWSLFEENAPCAVVSVSPVSPENWLGRIGRDGSFERYVGVGPVCRLNGAIYVHCWDDYVNGTPPRKTIAYVMPAARGVDIDTREDLEQARLLMERVGFPEPVGSST